MVSNAVSKRSAQLNIHKTRWTLSQAGKWQRREALPLAALALPRTRPEADEQASQTVRWLQDGTAVVYLKDERIGNHVVPQFNRFKFPLTPGLPVVYDRLIFGPDEQPVPDLDLHLEGPAIANSQAAAAATTYLAARILSITSHT